MSLFSSLFRRHKGAEGAPKKESVEKGSGASFGGGAFSPEERERRDGAERRRVRYETMGRDLRSLQGEAWMLARTQGGVAHPGEFEALQERIEAFSRKHEGKTRHDLQDSDPFEEEFAALRRDFDALSAGERESARSKGRAIVEGSPEHSERRGRFMSVKSHVYALLSEVSTFRRQKGGVELTKRLDELETRGRLLDRRIGAAYGDMDFREVETYENALAALRREFDDVRSSEGEADAIKGTLDKL